jgi:hypothetical protein
VEKLSNIREKYASKTSAILNKNEKIITKKNGLFGRCFI